MSDNTNIPRLLEVLDVFREFEPGARGLFEQQHLAKALAFALDTLGKGLADEIINRLERHHFDVTGEYPRYTDTGVPIASILKTTFQRLMDTSADDYDPAKLLAPLEPLAKALEGKIGERVEVADLGPDRIVFKIRNERYVAFFADDEEGQTFDSLAESMAKQFRNNKKDDA